MINLHNHGVYLIHGNRIFEEHQHVADEIRRETGISIDKNNAKKGTIAYQILSSHNSGDDQQLRLKFDSLTSHDITYVGIIQTAKASGMERFPVPYVLTNCHNSLCAVGGTINEDDHTFAFSAAHKYGGIYVPANLSVIHSYNREKMASCGKMILGSDSHTRYGALGTLAVGEGGGELVKQLLSRTYDIVMPEVVGVYLKGAPPKWIGPHDVALSIIKAVFEGGYVKNKVMEFVGEGVQNLSVEFRNGIDVMTTETTCWSSIWKTDEKVEQYFVTHGRPEAYRELSPDVVAYYDGMVEVDLSTIQCSIALPFHPANVYTIRELKQNAKEILQLVDESSKKTFSENGLSLNLSSKLHHGDIYVEQGIIAGCAGGTFDNLVATAEIMNGKSIGNTAFSMSVYPGSQPNYLELVKNGTIAKLMSSGVIVRESFCGPCFGAGDAPANGALSIRHTTRNFPNREGSKPVEGQLSSVALMDARSIAATAINAGKLTGADEVSCDYNVPQYFFDNTVYHNRVYDGFQKAEPDSSLTFGPNIIPWPDMTALSQHLLLKVVSYIDDAVTTTDELIPSGETSSYRSNPLRLAEFTLSRKDPAYVKEAKRVQELEQARMVHHAVNDDELARIYHAIQYCDLFDNISIDAMCIGSTIAARKPGDGSAREQAASCQRVLGARANIATEYATKRYRSNLINWGMLPLITDQIELFKKGSYLLIPNIRTQILEQTQSIECYFIHQNSIQPINMTLGELTDSEREILLDGCLINYYKQEQANRLSPI